MSTADPFDLKRFVEAQNGVYDRALAELRDGEKRSHWMWFIFPQLAGLGRSPTAVMYAIRSREEARSYLNHPLLGARLVECSEAVLSIERRSAHQVFGSPDDMKLQSSMTLFNCATLADKDRLMALVAEQLGVDKEKIADQKAFANELGSDSLDTVELVMELEEEFDVKVHTVFQRVLDKFFGGKHDARSLKIWNRLEGRQGE